MSMSTGELRVEGSRARYELRMPLYETTHLDEPEKTLLESFRIFSEGGEVVPSDGSCAAEPERDLFVCATNYELPAPTDRLDIECDFAAVTVPNHIHVLQGVQGDNTTQAVFDFGFRRATVRFTPPSFSEVLFGQMGAGFVRVLLGPFQILFLVAITLASRERKELLGLAGAFLAAEFVVAVVVAEGGWQPAPRFVEAAAALTVAYLAVEILLLPDAGYRWLVGAGMGLFHGLYFAGFLRQTEMHAAYVLAGVALAEILLIGLFALLLTGVQNVAARLQPVRLGAGLLLVIGIVWFALRLRG